MTNLARLFDGVPAGASRADLGAAFDSAEPAAAFGPLPPGEYVARWVACGLDEAKTGTPFFFGRFEIANGDCAGRRLTYRWFLSKAALPYSRRDLAALGLTTFAQLQSGEVPSCAVLLRVALRRDDSGATWNEVRGVVPADGAPIAQRNEATAATPVSPSATQTPASSATAGELPAELVDADFF